MDNILEFVLVRDDSKYQVKLPWIEDHPPLPTNLKVAQKRINNFRETY